MRYSILVQEDDLEITPALNFEYYDDEGWGFGKWYQNGEEVYEDVLEMIFGEASICQLRKRCQAQLDAKIAHSLGYEYTDDYVNNRNSRIREYEND